MTPPLTDAELEELERLADRARYAYAPDVVQITDAIDALVAEVRALRAAADHHSTVINDQMAQLSAAERLASDYKIAHDVATKQIAQLVAERDGLERVLRSIHAGITSLRETSRNLHEKTWLADIERVLTAPATRSKT